MDSKSIKRIKVRNVSTHLMNNLHKCQNSSKSQHKNLQIQEICEIYGPSDAAATPITIAHSIFTYFDLVMRKQCGDVRKMLKVALGTGKNGFARMSRDNEFGSEEEFCAVCAQPIGEEEYHYFSEIAIAAADILPLPELGSDEAPKNHAVHYRCTVRLYELYEIQAKHIDNLK